ncbi:diguanylate cyclase domain-containing protein [Alkanindiges sp. WGS2144]|uniref:sensor domain-containing diguanylate cyclase n=1 Tax=Alkanindiges sp. WGS2144 TaxID=3366808 RepID=UPI0037527F7E
MNTIGFSDFESAGCAVLKYLHERFGFDLWMITRTEGDDWIVLQAEDHGYGVKAGQVFRWADSFCSEMVKGNGPCIAPNAQEVPLYAAAPIRQQVGIQAYIGQPLKYADEKLFGTLCAIHPEPQPPDIVNDQPLLELLGRLLSTILQSELEKNEQQRRVERLEAESMTDALTHLYNRRGWDRLLAAEEERCRRHGHPAAVLVIDLNHLKLVNDKYGHAAGNELIQRAANALREATRVNDIVARLGGDEFGILSAECNEEGAQKLLQRIDEAFQAENVQGSVGMAMRHPSTGLVEAWLQADKLMYAHKKARYDGSLSPENN